MGHRTLAILSSHKEVTDKMSIIDVANEFVDAKPNRKSIFGNLSKRICKDKYFK